MSPCCNACGSGRRRDISRFHKKKRAHVRTHRTIGDASIPTSTADFSAQLQAQLKQQSASVQQTIAGETGVDTSNARVTQGASSAVSLIQNGYNPSSSDDNAKLIHAIAGGLCLIPGVGVILGGAVEGLWLVGNEAACPVTNAFASIGIGVGSTQCGKPPCQGPKPPAKVSDIFSGHYTLPAMPKGSFAAFVIAALAQAATQNANCQGGIPPDVIVDACVAIWNRTHAGPAVGYLCPPIALAQSGQLLRPGPASWIVGVTQASVSDSKTGNVNPYIYYGFQPVSAIAKHDGLSTGTGYGHVPSNPNTPQEWEPWLWLPPFLGATVPRIIAVNSGALLPPPAPPPKKTLALHLGPVPTHLPVAPDTDKVSSPLAPKSSSSGGVVATASVLGVVALGAVLVHTGAVKLPVSLARLFR